MKIIRALGKVLAIVILLILLVLGLATLLEYRPQEVTELAPVEGDRVFNQKEFSVLIYNIGYGGLGDDADFFMDGGSSVHPQSKEVVEKNLEGIAQELKDHPVDFYLFQEVDLSSKRSYGLNQQAFIEKSLGLKGSFGTNYKAFYVPYPLPTIGKVHSGLLSLSSYRSDRVYRKSLPVPFSWPTRTMNLKRCLLVEEFPIEGSEQKLILINLHLEAYDSGEGKKLQSETLLHLAQSYYAQGHYVLAGGDWNQLFPGSEEPVPERGDQWIPGKLMKEDLPDGWRYIADLGTPSCRSLHEAYEGEGHLVYYIDGYLASPNLTLESVETLDFGFTHSDHHPVLLKMRLGE